MGRLAPVRMLCCSRCQPQLREAKLKKVGFFFFYKFRNKIYDTLIKMFLHSKLESRFLNKWKLTILCPFLHNLCRDDVSAVVEMLDSLYYITTCALLCSQTYHKHVFLSKAKSKVSKVKNICAFLQSSWKKLFAMDLANKII